MHLYILILKTTFGWLGLPVLYTAVRLPVLTCPEWHTVWNTWKISKTGNVRRQNIVLVASSSQEVFKNLHHSFSPGIHYWKGCMSVWENVSVCGLYVCTCVWLFKCMWLCVHIYMIIYMCMCVIAYMCAYVCDCVCLPMHIYMYTLGTTLALKPPISAL